MYLNIYLLSSTNSIFTISATHTSLLESPIHAADTL